VAGGTHFLLARLHVVFKRALQTVAAPRLQLELVHLVAARALHAPLLEQAQGQRPQDRAVLPIEALLELIQYYIHFENLAQTLPKLERTGETAVVKTVLKLREVCDLELRLEVELNFCSLRLDLLSGEDPAHTRPV